MDAARQVLRFSIPGSITILWSILLGMMGRLFQGDSPEGITSALQNNVGAAIAILASIPVGFLIFQIYYLGYRPFIHFWPPSFRKRWIRLDRGAQVIAALPPEQQVHIAELFGESHDIREIHRYADGPIKGRLKVLELTQEYENEFGDAKERYERRWESNWNTMRALVELCDASDAGSAIRSEYTTLSDIYHSLGACRTAAWVGWIISLGLAIAYVAYGGSRQGAAEAVAVGFVATAMLAFVFHRTRRLTWTSAQDALTLGLIAAFKRKPDLLRPPRKHLGLISGSLRLPPFSLESPIGDRILNQLLIIAVRFRAWLLGGVFTAGAMALVVNSDGAILMVKPWYRRGWGLPGGFMKFGEQPADALRRELLEETGIAVQPDRMHEVYVQRGRRHIDHLFVMSVGSKQSLRARRKGEITRISWREPTDLPPLQREAHEALSRLGQATGLSH